MPETSGICGFVAPNAAAENLPAMLAKLSAFGADSASWKADHAGFGTRAPEGQPAVCTDEAAGLAAVAATRLDDRQALCDVLGAPAASDDASLILRAWRRWGGDCPNHLLGDFAFAIFDSRKRELFCARDQVGMQPFHYAVRGERFVFASSVQAVLAAPGVSDELNETTVAESLVRPVLRSPSRTFFRDVSRLPAGHTLTFARGKVRLSRYWRPERIAVARPASDADAEEELLHLMQQAVSDRLTEGPFGVDLSGGLDSSAMTALVARELRRRNSPPPTAFTTLPPASPSHSGVEYDAMASICGAEGVRLVHRPPTAEQLVRALRRDYAYPGGEGASWADSEPTEFGVRTMISGYGGDQGSVSSNGFGYLEQLLLTGHWRSAWKMAKENRSRPWRSLVWTTLEMLYPGARRAYRRWRWPSRRTRQSEWLVHPNFARHAPPRTRNRVLSVRSGQLNILRDGHFQGQMEATTIGAATGGVATRFPLLDLRVLEFGFRLPPDYYLRGGQDRWLFRRVLAQLLPGVQFATKQCPIMVELDKEVFRAALPLLHKALKERDTPPGRSQYVDMPRLFERLEQEASRDMPRSSLVLAPLRLLLF